MRFVLLTNDKEPWGKITQRVKDHTKADVFHYTDSIFLKPTDVVLIIGSFRNLPAAKYMGMDRLSRLERMPMLESVDVPVVPWLPIDQLDLAYDKWGSDIVVFKSDQSFQGKGVQLISEGQALPKIANPKTDILMQYIVDQPTVLKVYFLHGIVVGCYEWQLPSLSQPGFYKTVEKAVEEAGLAKRLKVPPTELHEPLKRLMRHAVNRGFGWCSIDFMQYKGRWKAIEMNMSGVGVDMVLRLEPLFNERFALGMINCVKSIDQHQQKIFRVSE